MVDFFDTSAVFLDAELFQDKPSTYTLAAVVSEEVENQRVAEGGQTQPYKVTFADIAKPDFWTGPNNKKWHEFAADLKLLQRCSRRLGLSLPQTVERVYKELSPPNWETLFWMHAFVETLSENAREMAVLKKQIDFAGQRAISEQQQKYAAERHAENRAMKAEVFAWLDTNRANYKSMDSTAEAIAGKIAPIAFRTARDWVGEWKRLRSTGTP